MTADLIVYRSVHPEVLRAWDTNQTLTKTLREARRRYLDGLGFTDRRALLSDNRIIGVEYQEDDGPVPDGWVKRRSVENAIVPDRRRSAGKKIAQKLDSLALPDIRSKLLGGMPDSAWDLHEGRFCRPGVRLMSGALYVTWGVDPTCDASTDISPQVWERIKLSEYYAAVEAFEAAQAEKGGA